LDGREQIMLPMDFTGSMTHGVEWLVEPKRVLLYMLLFQQQIL
jgi:hypothetical protein